MKNIKSYILLGLGVILLASCSDDYMTELNTDTSKVASIDPNTQLTTAQLQTYGDINTMETYRSYIYAFTQQLMGCWNTTNYGGRHSQNDSEMSRVWNSFYPNALKNIVDAQYRTDNDPDKVNINAAARIYKVYLSSLLTDIYGDVPYSEVGLGFLEGIFNPKYDKQEDIYTDFFTELAKAVDSFDASKARITGDLMLGGDVELWKKFANSLRLRFAMRISDVAPAVAKQEFEAALAADGGIMEQASDDALIKYMEIAFSFAGEAYSDYRGNRLSQLLFGNDPIASPGGVICSTLFNQLYNTGDPRLWLMTRYYYDGLMPASAPENRMDITQEMIGAGFDFISQLRNPGAFVYDPWPTAYESAMVTAYEESHPGFDAATGNAEAYMVYPKITTNFLSGANPGVVMTSAEVKFLLAEATLKGWNVNRGTVEELYNAGVRASMDFLATNYGTTPVSDADFAAYMRAGAGGNINSYENPKAAINIQSWMLHFTNPVECWSNLRRSGYPVTKSPAEYGFANQLVNGAEIPVRLCYPILEGSYNKASYDEALSRMGGTNSWNTPVWWDVNATE
jgi:hypothetical protein